jgi:NTP pyrophosphatase (non-canonical NTP hydrolase)
MTLTDYAAWAETIHSEATTGDRDRLLAYLGLGLTSEAGEVASEIKKLLRDGTLNADAVAEELGDVFYHWIRLVTALDRSPEDILAASRTKITAKAAANPR